MVGSQEPNAIKRCIALAAKRLTQEAWPRGITSEQGSGIAYWGTIGNHSHNLWIQLSFLSALEGINALFLTLDISCH